MNWLKLMFPKQVMHCTNNLWTKISMEPIENSPWMLQILYLISNWQLVSGPNIIHWLITPLTGQSALQSSQDQTVDQAHSVVGLQWRRWISAAQACPFPGFADLIQDHSLLSSCEDHLKSPVCSPQQCQIGACKIRRCVKLDTCSDIWNSLKSQAGLFTCECTEKGLIGSIFETPYMKTCFQTGVLDALP